MLPKQLRQRRPNGRSIMQNYPFNYAFLDDTYQNLYITEMRTGKLYNVFSGIAIFISCLGLLGLVTYTAQIRTRGNWCKRKYWEQM